MKKIPLYEIHSRLKNLFRKIDEAGGEISPALELELDNLNMTLNNKLCGCWKAIKSYEADAEMLKAEAKKLQARAKAAENKAEYARKYVERHLEPGSDWSFGPAAFGWRKSTAVAISNESRIPDEFIKIERTPKKAEIKAALQAGDKVRGCALEERQNLQVL